MKTWEYNHSKPGPYHEGFRWYCQELVKMKSEWESKWTIGRDCPNHGEDEKVWKGAGGDDV